MTFLHTSASVVLTLSLHTFSALFSKTRAGLWAVSQEFFHHCGIFVFVPHVRKVLDLTKSRFRNCFVTLLFPHPSLLPRHLRTLQGRFRFFPAGASDGTAYPNPVLSPAMWPPSRGPPCSDVATSVTKLKPKVSWFLFVPC